MLCFDHAAALRALADPSAAGVARCDAVLSSLSRLRPVPSGVTDLWLDRRLEAMRDGVG